MSHLTKRVLSLGAGTQSSVLALLLSREDPRLIDLGYPKPDAALFADTGWEPQSVYSHLDWLEQQLSFPVLRVARKNSLKDDLLKGKSASGSKYIEVPFYLWGPEGKGMLRRRCTVDYKITPIYRAVRELSGVKRGRPFPKEHHIEMWIGISRDEASRMKPSREWWVENRWPLVDLGFTRKNCSEWFAAEYPGRYLPRSACIICPYHNNQYWENLKENEPGHYQEAVDFDIWLRSNNNPMRDKLNGQLFIHSSRIPLGEFMDRWETRDDVAQMNMFENECEGHCGV